MLHFMDIGQHIQITIIPIIIIIISYQNPQGASECLILLLFEEGHILLYGRTILLQNTFF